MLTILDMPTPMKKTFSIGGFVKPFVSDYPNAFTGAGTPESYADLDQNLGFSYVADSTKPELSERRHKALLDTMYQCLNTGVLKYK
jgi:hypothetical protein